MIRVALTLIVAGMLGMAFVVIAPAEPDDVLSSANAIGWLCAVFTMVLAGWLLFSPRRGDVE